MIFGPFYAVAIYAYARGREWIRLPSVLWAGMMLANVTIILFDELLGAHARYQLAVRREIQDP